MSWLTVCINRDCKCLNVDMKSWFGPHFFPAVNHLYVYHCCQMSWRISFSDFWTGSVVLWFISSDTEISPKGAKSLPLQNKSVFLLSSGQVAFPLALMGCFEPGVGEGKTHMSDECWKRCPLSLSIILFTGKSGTYQPAMFERHIYCFTEQEISQGWPGRLNC